MRGKLVALLFAAAVFTASHAQAQRTFCLGSSLTTCASVQVRLLSFDPSTTEFRVHYEVLALTPNLTGGEFFFMFWELTTSAGQRQSFNTSSAMADWLNGGFDQVLSVTGSIPWWTLAPGETLVDVDEQGWMVSFASRPTVECVPLYNSECVEVSTVPEPVTLVLLGSGLFGIGGVALRRRGQRGLEA
jgi:hypothetical protein